MFDTTLKTHCNSINILVAFWLCTGKTFQNNLKEICRWIFFTVVGTKLTHTRNGFTRRIDSSRYPSIYNPGQKVVEGSKK